MPIETESTIAQKSRVKFLTRVFVLSAIGVSAVAIVASVLILTEATVVNISSCQTISASGDYQITQNLAGGDPCITITANNVTLDGQNFSITGGMQFNHLTNVIVRRVHMPGGVNFSGGTGNQIVDSSFRTLGFDLATYSSAIHNVITAMPPDGRAVWIGDLNNLGTRYITLQDNTISGDNIQNSRFIVQTHTDHNTIKNNTVTLTNAWHTADDVSAMFMTYYSHHNRISDNTFTMTLQPGSYSIGVHIRDQSSDNVYDNNTIDIPNRPLSFGSGNGIGSPHDNYFINNKVYGNDRVLEIQSSEGTNTFKNNLIFARNGSAVWAGGIGKNATVIFDHNTFASVNGPNFSTDNQESNKKIFWTNNIFYAVNDKIHFMTTYTLVALPDRTDNNLYYREGTGTWTDYGGIYSSFTQWKTAGNNVDDNLDRDQNSVTYDPATQSLFQDFTARDFHLTTLANNAARGRGQGGSDIGANLDLRVAPPPVLDLASCAPDWRCSTFSACTGSTVTRWCADYSGCGVETGQPPQSLACTADITSPTVSLTAPVAGAVVTGTANLSASASDNVGVVSVLFKDGMTAIGAEDTTAPYTATWNTTGLPNGSHTLSVIARDVTGNTASTTLSVTVNGGSTGCTENWTCSAWSTCAGGVQTRTCTDSNSCGTTTYRPPLSQPCSTTDTIPPTVAVTAPTTAATVGGTVAVAASATDNVGVFGVQFKVDSVNLGAEDTTAPYGASWNTTTLSNGSHIITAVARDTGGNVTTSAVVTVNVSNLVTGPVSCGANCTGSATNYILGPACTTPSRISTYSKNNAIEDITLNKSSAESGTAVTATITYNCSADNPSRDGIALWYYNGTWQLLTYWPAIIPGCDNSYAPDTDGTLQKTFAAASGTTQNQFIRAVISSAPPTANTSSCPNIIYGNIDDIGLTVTKSAGGGGGPRRITP